MNSSTLNTKLAEFQKPRSEESGDSEENLSSRREARLTASLAVEGLNRLREKKTAAKPDKK